MPTAFKFLSQLTYICFQVPTECFNVAHMTYDSLSENICSFQGPTWSILTLFYRTLLCFGSSLFQSSICPLLKCFGQPFAFLSFCAPPPLTPPFPLQNVTSFLSPFWCPISLIFPSLLHALHISFIKSLIGYVTLRAIFLVME